MNNLSKIALSLSFALLIASCGSPQPGGSQSGGSQSGEQEGQYAGSQGGEDLAEKIRQANKETAEKIDEDYPYEPYRPDNKQAPLGSDKTPEQIEEERQKALKEAKYTSLSQAARPKFETDHSKLPKPLHQHNITLFATPEQIDAAKGDITIEYVIDRDGQVIRSIVLENKTGNEELGKIAAHAVSQWRYEENDGPYLLLHVFSFGATE